MIQRLYFWNESSLHKCSLYKLIQEVTPKRPWFIDPNDMRRPFIATICRIKFGKCFSHSHIQRTHYINSPNCECGEIGNINYATSGTVRLMNCFSNLST